MIIEKVANRFHALQVFKKWNRGRSHAEVAAHESLSKKSWIAV
jgi:hypothetical protein